MYFQVSVLVLLPGAPFPSLLAKLLCILQDPMSMTVLLEGLPV